MRKGRVLSATIVPEEEYRVSTLTRRGDSEQMVERDLLSVA